MDRIPSRMSQTPVSWLRDEGRTPWLGSRDCGRCERNVTTTSSVPTSPHDHRSDQATQEFLVPVRLNWTTTGRSWDSLGVSEDCTVHVLRVPRHVNLHVEDGACFRSPVLSFAPDFNSDTRRTIRHTSESLSPGLFPCRR